MDLPVDSAPEEVMPPSPPVDLPSQPMDLPQIDTEPKPVLSTATGVTVC